MIGNVIKIIAGILLLVRAVYNLVYLVGQPIETVEALGFILMTGVMLLVGVGLLWWAYKSRRRPSAVGAAASAEVLPIADEPVGDERGKV